MAEVTPTVAESGNSQVDDIRVETITFTAADDHAFVSTQGYDYVSFLPIGPDGTEPSAGTTSFLVYGWTTQSGTFVEANQALVPEEAGRHKRATVTSSARNAGYLVYPPKNITVEMQAGTGSPADMVLRVELRKRRAVATNVGRG